MINVNEKIVIRRANERGHANLGWLDTYHTFSFADYFDPKYLGFKSLRVINEDRVKAGEGFRTHPHKNIEIISYVIEGELQHRDNLGNSSIIRAGNVQRMSAGSGVFHSEFNPSSFQDVHFLQIWITPEKKDIRPSYQDLTLGESHGLELIAAREPKESALTVHQDIRVIRGILSPGDSSHYALQPGRGLWIQMVRGQALVNNRRLFEGDGAAVEGEMMVRIFSFEDTEFFLFDMA